MKQSLKFHQHQNLARRSIPRKPRCRNEFLAVQYTIGALRERTETIEVMTDELAGRLMKIMK